MEGNLVLLAYPRPECIQGLSPRFPSVLLSPPALRLASLSLTPVRFSRIPRILLPGWSAVYQIVKERCGSELGGKQGMLCLARHRSIEPGGEPLAPGCTLPGHLGFRRIKGGGFKARGYTGETQT